jgi:hypothetical protein
MSRKVAKVDPERLKRAVMWRRLPGHGHTIDEVCKRFGVSKSAYRVAAREMKNTPLYRTDEDLILAGLHPSGAVTVDRLIFYYDWINHGLLTPDEVVVILERLIERGLVRRVGVAFELTREWP